MKRLHDHHSNDTTNRVSDAIYLYAEQETQLKISNPLESRNVYQVSTLKLQYYNSIYATFKKDATTEEKRSLRFIRHEMARIKASLNPTTLNKILYSDLSNRLRYFISRNKLFYKTLTKKIRNIDRNLTEEHNYQSLSGEMKKAGFNYEMEGTLKKMIAQNLPQFHLRYADLQNTSTDYVLHFKKIPQTDLYYFEKFDAISRPSLDALLKNDPSCKRHTFPLQGTQKFSAKEAASLVAGNGVCKTVEGKELWLILEQTAYGQQSSFHYVSFDLEKAIEKLPIKQLDNPTQEKVIIETLKSGAAKEVTFIINNQHIKYTIQAVPLRKAISITDRYNQPIDTAKILKGQMPALTAKLVKKLNDPDTTIDLGHQQSQGRRPI